MRAAGGKTPTVAIQGDPLVITLNDVMKRNLRTWSRFHGGMTTATRYQNTFVRDDYAITSKTDRINNTTRHRQQEPVNT